MDNDNNNSLDLPSLTTLFIGQAAFNRSLRDEKRMVDLEALPSLQSMFVGPEALATISKLRVVCLLKETERSFLER